MYVEGQRKGKGKVERERMPRSAHALILMESRG